MFLDFRSYIKVGIVFLGHVSPFRANLGPLKCKQLCSATIRTPVSGEDAFQILLQVLCNTELKGMREGMHGGKSVLSEGSWRQGCNLRTRRTDWRDGGEKEDKDSVNDRRKRGERVSSP